jgi:hypothetical protein
MLFVVIVFKLGCAIAGATIAARKNRSAGVWFFVCLLFTLLGLIILACLPSLSTETEALADAGPLSPEWQAKIAEDPALARAVDTIRPYGTGLVTKFMDTYTSAAEKTDPVLLAQTIRDSRETDPGHLLEKVEPHLSFFAKAKAGNVAIMKNGEALLEQNGTIVRYPDAFALREATGDHEQWPHIDDLDVKRTVAVAISPHIPATA